MVKYSVLILFDDIVKAPSERVQTGTMSQKIRDLDVFFQFNKGIENDFGVGLKVVIPSLYNNVQIRYDMWVKKASDKSLIRLRSSDRSCGYDNGREYGSNAKNIQSCHISFSRLSEDCVQKNIESSKLYVEFLWEIVNINCSYNNSLILENLFSSDSPFMKIVLDSEIAYSDYKYHKKQLNIVNSSAKSKKKKIHELEQKLNQLETKIPELEKREEDNLKLLAIRKDILSESVKNNKIKTDELQKQDLVKSLLQMSASEVEIFQFDPKTLESISEGILRIQSNLTRQINT